MLREPRIREDWFEKKPRSLGESLREAEDLTIEIRCLFQRINDKVTEYDLVTAWQLPEITQRKKFHYGIIDEEWIPKTFDFYYRDAKWGTVEADRDLHLFISIDLRYSEGAITVGCYWNPSADERISDVREELKSDQSHMELGEYFEGGQRCFQLSRTIQPSELIDQPVEVLLTELVRMRDLTRTSEFLQYLDSG